MYCICSFSNKNFHVQWLQNHNIFIKKKRKKNTLVMYHCKNVKEGKRCLTKPFTGSFVCDHWKCDSILDLKKYSTITWRRYYIIYSVFWTWAIEKMTKAFATMSPYGATQSICLIVDRFIVHQFYYRFEHSFWVILR